MSSEPQSRYQDNSTLEERLKAAGEAFRESDYNKVISLLADMESVFSEALNTSIWAYAILTLGPAYLEVGRLDEAKSLLEQGAEWARRVNDRDLLCTFLHELSCVALRSGDVDQLFMLSRQSVQIALETGKDLLMNLPNLCVACRATGQSDLARQLLEHLLVHALRQSDAKSLGISLNQLGGLFFDLGDFYTGLQCFLGSIHFKGCIRNEAGIRVSLLALQECLISAEDFHQDTRATNLLRRRMFLLRMLAGSLLDPNHVVHVSQEDIDNSHDAPPLYKWTELLHHFRPLCPEAIGQQATFITPQHERAIAEQESNPGDIQSARGILEAALIQQFRALADGLAIDALFRGEYFHEGTWCQQLVAARAPLKPPKGWFHSALRNDKEVFHPSKHRVKKGSAESQHPPDWDTRSYRECLLRDALERKRRPFSPTRLMEVKVRLYGGTVPLWNDMAINHQLKQLGSDFRVIFLGAWDVSRALMCRALGVPGPAQLDPRFLFGRVAPLTAHCIAPLFDFEQEYALSPYVRANGPAFQHEGRAVVRTGTMQLLGMTENRDWRQGRERYTQLHDEELMHILSANFVDPSTTVPDPYSYSQLMWLDDYRGDLRRFVESPRSQGDIEDVFAFAFDSIHFQLPSIQGHTLISLLEGLVKDGTIAVGSDGLYRACRFHETGAPWDR